MTESELTNSGVVGGMKALFAPWMVLSLLTVVLWGAWGLQSKIISDRMSPWMNQVLFPIGLIPAVLWALRSKNVRRVTAEPRKGIWYAFLTGVLGGSGNIAFFLALASGGKASIVVPLVGLAPLVTVALALVILKESLTKAQIVGLGFALVSIYLLSV
jgi:bacterial/archaeal transporter family protein